MAGLQSWALWNERTRLNHTLTAQQPTIDQARKVRAQLDALARETMQLAEAGNANARSLLEALARRGIHFDPDQDASPQRSKHPR